MSDLQTRIVALQDQWRALDREAQQHEADAKESRRKMSEVKEQLQQLGANVLQAQVSQAAQQAAKAAESAQKHAEMHAASAASLVQQLQAELERFQKLNEAAAAK